jgi:hypothetical protein
LSLPNRTVSIVAGTPVTASGAPGNEAVVTFTDEAAAPGELKICKLVGSFTAPLTPPTTNTFTFTSVVPASPGYPLATYNTTVTFPTATVTVGESACAFVGATASNNFTPALIPFNATVNNTENVPSGQAVTAINEPTGESTVVTVLEGATPGVITPTNEILLNGVTASGPFVLPTSTATISENAVTEIDYYDIDPPAGFGTTPVVVDPITGTVSSVVAPSSSTTSPAVTSSVSGSSSIGTSITSVTNTVKTAVKPLTAAQRKAELKSAQKSLSNVEKAINAQTKTVAHTKGAAHKAAQKRLNVLKAEERALNAKIKALK